MLVGIEHQRVLFPARNEHRHDFFGEASFLLGSGGLFLGTEGEQVLILPLHLVLFGHVLRRFRHGIDAVLLFHQGIHKAPADGGVLNLLAT